MNNKATALEYLQTIVDVIIPNVNQTLHHYFNNQSFNNELFIESINQSSIYRKTIHRKII